MSAITAPVYDPTSTATALAQKTTAAAQQILTTQTSNASATAAALSKLGLAISGFQTSLGSLAGYGKTMLAQSATLSDTTVGTASAKSTAAAGSYSLFVDRLATASQVSYTPVNDPSAQGSLTVTLAPPTAPTPPAVPGPSSPATASFTVDLSAADTDNVAGLSVREVATAINNDPKNAGQVSAGVVTVNGTSQLVLTSKNTGAANTIWVSTSGPVDASGNPVPDANGNPIPAYKLGSRTEITAAQDALIQYGGTPITNSSNTFSNIDGVTMTFTRAQSASEQPFTLTVGSDTNGTVSNVQAFVDAYNNLKSLVDVMVDPGDPANGKAAGAFAHDAGVKALQSRLVSMVRPTGSMSLASYGIAANLGVIGARDGKLKLDSARLNKQLSVNPTGLDVLIGSASATKPTGVAGALNTYLTLWSNSVGGQIKQRSDATTKLQAALVQRQSDIDTQYNNAYDRYLKQFTALQSLQSTMNSNVSMFDALFGNDKSS